jgi:HEAT repeat protein
MIDILKKLEGGDLRSIGRSEEVVQDVLADPGLFEELLQGMLHEDPGIRMRSADAVEKVTHLHPEYLHPHKDLLLTQIAKIEQQEVRWHVAQIIPRLDLTVPESEAAIEILKGYLEDDSRIVRTFAMDALAGFAERNPELQPWVLTLVEEMVEIGSPSMQARGRKLLARLRKPE